MGKDILNFRNKKAVSVMVSYVLLIVIAISISVFVYSYLKLYLPENRRECEADVRIVVTNVSCIANRNSGDLSFIMENRGLFNISAAFVKFDVINKTVKAQISADDARLRPPLFSGPLAPGDGYEFNYINLTSKLSVGAISTKQNYYELEIEPGVFQDGYLVPCKKAIITYPVTCISQ